MYYEIDEDFVEWLFNEMCKDSESCETCCVNDMTCTFYGLKDKRFDL